MTKLIPLAHDGADDFELELIRSAQQDVPSAGAKLKVLSMVATGVAVAGAAHAAAVTVSSKAVATGSAGAAATTGGQSIVTSSVGKAATLSLLKWLGAGAIAGTVLSAGATAVMPDRSAAIAPRVAQAVATAPGIGQPARKLAGAPNEVPAPETDSDEAPSDVAPPPSAGAPKPGVVDELKLLDDARKAVAVGDARAALAALDARQKRHGAGTLGPEAEVLRVEALAAAGQRQAAVVRAQGFLAQNPSSPHAGRVRSLLARLRAEARAAQGVAAPSSVEPAVPETKPETPVPTGPSKASFGAAPAQTAGSTPPSKASFPAP